MGAFTKDHLLAKAFSGFVTFAELKASWLDVITKGPGVYVVFRDSGEAPTFLSANTGGRFKGKDPTAAVADLQRKWVAGAQVIYIGKASVLQRRLRQYADFGAGKPVGHWGGRYVWQLADAADLIVAWRRCTPPETEGQLEALLIADFKREFGRIPFANIAEPR